MKDEDRNYNSPSALYQFVEDCASDSESSDADKAAIIRLGKDVIDNGGWRGNISVAWKNYFGDRFYDVIPSLYRFI